MAARKQAAADSESANAVAEKLRRQNPPSNPPANPNPRPYYSPVKTTTTVRSVASPSDGYVRRNEGGGLGMSFELEDPPPTGTIAVASVSQDYDLIRQELQHQEDDDSSFISVAFKSRAEPATPKGGSGSMPSPGTSYLSPYKSAEASRVNASRKNAGFLASAFASRADSTAVDNGRGVNELGTSMGDMEPLLPEEDEGGEDEWDCADLDPSLLSNLAAMIDKMNTPSAVVDKPTTPIGVKSDIAVIELPSEKEDVNREAKRLDVDITDDKNVVDDDDDDDDDGLSDILMENQASATMLSNLSQLIDKMNQRGQPQSEDVKSVENINVEKPSDDLAFPSLTTTSRSLFEANASTSEDAGDKSKVLNEQVVNTGGLVKEDAAHKSDSLDRSVLNTSVQLKASNECFASKTSLESKVSNECVIGSMSIESKASNEKIVGSTPIEQNASNECSAGSTLVESKASNDGAVYSTSMDSKASNDGVVDNTSAESKALNECEDHDQNVAEFDQELAGQIAQLHSMVRKAHGELEFRADGDGDDINNPELSLSEDLNENRRHEMEHDGDSYDDGNNSAEQILELGNTHDPRNRSDDSVSANSADNENGDEPDVGSVTHEPRNEPGDSVSANSAENEKGDQPNVGSANASFDDGPDLPEGASELEINKLNAFLLKIMMISEVGKPSKEDLDVLFNDAKLVGLSEETVLQIFEESSVPEQIGKENDQIGTENEKIAKAKKSKAPKKEKDTFHSGARQRVFLANSGKFDIKQFWVSPWDMRYTTKKGKKLKARKTAGSNSDGTMDSIPKIKSVDVVKIWLRRDDRPSSKGKKLRIPTEQHWKLSKKDPSRSHEGIHGIPSHYNNPLITESHKFDSLKWEDRKVEQTFLAPVYANSHWFGKFFDQNELMLFHDFV